MPTVVNAPPYDPGFFSCMATVLGALDAYERGAAGDGLRVDLSRGRYFDRSRGGNWWEYHFAPVRIGRQDGPDVPIGDHAALAFDAIVWERRRAHDILARHVRACGDVEQTVHEFRARYFAGRAVVGLHFRGTDKPAELTSVASYEQAIGCAQQQLAARGADAVVFAASDEEDFIASCERAFGARCVSTPAARSRRGGPGIHFTRRNGFVAGREALIDCLLLAACDVLVRTSSNLGQFAGYFSPEMPVFKLNRSYFERE